MTQIKVQTSKNHNTTAFGPNQNRAEQKHNRNTQAFSEEPAGHGAKAEGRDREKNGVIRRREQGLLGEWRERSSHTVCQHAAADQHMLQ